MFEEAIDEFNLYMKRMVQTGVEEFHPALTAECLNRIRQLQHIFSKVMSVQQEAVELNNELSSICMHELEKDCSIDEAERGVLKDRRYELARRIGSLGTDAEILTESFYYTAGRLVNIISHKTNPVLLGKFKLLGVTVVRNHLIVHPEGANSEIFSLSFAMGSQRGPIIKPMRAPSEYGRHEDKGLVDNAAELNEKLLLKIREGNRRLDDETPRSRSAKSNKSVLIKLK